MNTIDVLHLLSRLNNLQQQNYERMHQKALSGIKECARCHTQFSDRPFGNMNGMGERTVADLQLYNNAYHLCPKCTHELYKWITEPERK